MPRRIGDFEFPEDWTSKDIQKFFARKDVQKSLRPPPTKAEEGFARASTAAIPIVTGLGGAIVGGPVGGAVGAGGGQAARLALLREMGVEPDPGMARQALGGLPGVAGDVLDVGEAALFGGATGAVKKGAAALRQSKRAKQVKEARSIGREGRQKIKEAEQAASSARQTSRESLPLGVGGALRFVRTAKEAREAGKTAKRVKEVVKSRPGSAASRGTSKPGPKPKLDVVKGSAETRSIPARISKVTLKDGPELKVVKGGKEARKVTDQAIEAGEKISTKGLPAAAKTSGARHNVKYFSESKKTYVDIEGMNQKNIEFAINKMLRKRAEKALTDLQGKQLSALLKESRFRLGDKGIHIGFSGAKGTRGQLLTPAEIAK
jgi:hypothetical protein